MKFKKSIGFLLGLVLLIFACWASLNPSIEHRFNAYEPDFQARADAFINGQKYSGAERWLEARRPGEGAQYLSFHMGKDYKFDYYDPRIVYVHTDSTKGVHLCSFDGTLIKKIKKRWYICKESRF